MSALIDHDLLCVHCRYNLRGLSPEGTCPECGQAAADSTAGHHLRFADRQWLRRLAWGARLLPIGVVLVYWVGVLSLALSIVGLVLLTVRDPRQVLVEPWLNARIVTRWGGALFVAYTVASYVWLTNVRSSPPLLVAALGMTLGAIVVWSAGTYFAALAGRLTDAMLEKVLRGASRSLSLCLTVAAILMAAFHFVRHEALLVAIILPAIVGLLCSILALCLFAWLLIQVEGIDRALSGSPAAPD